MAWVRVAMLAGLVAMAAPAFAQDPDAAKCRDAEFDSHSATLGDNAALGGASFKKTSVRSGSEGNCRVVSFFRVGAKPPGPRAQYRDKTAPPFFAARYVGDDRKAPYKVQWTDEKRCPALVQALQKLEPILAPKLTGDGPYRDMLGSAAGQAVYRAWLSGPVYPQRDEDYTLSVNVESGSNTVFAKWLDETFATLAPCWAADVPVVE
jgi:hypothetical protein